MVKGGLLPSCPPSKKAGNAAQGNTVLPQPVKETLINADFLLPAKEDEIFQGGVYSAYSTLWKIEDDEGREQKDQ
jgi:hypothetical protein